jgi:hypothetical protein
MLSAVPIQLLNQMATQGRNSNNFEMIKEVIYKESSRRKLKCQHNTQIFVSPIFHSQI